MAHPDNGLQATTHDPGSLPRIRAIDLVEKKTTRAEVGVRMLVELWDGLYTSNVTHVTAGDLFRPEFPEGIARLRCVKRATRLQTLPIDRARRKAALLPSSDRRIHPDLPFRLISADSCRRRRGGTALVRGRVSRSNRRWPFPVWASRVSECAASARHDNSSQPLADPSSKNRPALSNR